MLKNGHLREFVSDGAKNNYGNTKGGEMQNKPASLHHTINIMFRGTEVNGVNIFSGKKNTKVLVTHENRTQEAPDYEDMITFKDADADGLTLPHNDLHW